MQVHSFESFAATDGGGVRLCVFLSGCALRCVYCHNPDTWDRSASTAYTPAQIVQKACRYRPYFGAGRGGVTFSGGEPLLQAEEVAETEELLAAAGIGSAIDTSGTVPLDGPVCRALQAAAFVLCDLKFPSEDAFYRYTGGHLAPVLRTLAFLSEHGIDTRVRTVVVPGLNDCEADMDAYGEILARYSSVTEYRLLPFHRMGFEKYERLGVQNPLRDTEAADAARVAALEAYVNRLIGR